MLTDSDRARIAAAMTDAESRTSGEISCVLAGEVSHYREVPFAWAAFVALVLPPIALMLGFYPPLLAEWVQGGWSGTDAGRDVVLALSVYATLQVALFAIVAILASLAPIRRRLTPRFLKRHRVRESARRHFLAAGTHLRQEQPYVLVFASATDRVVEIVASEEIHRKSGGEAWDRAAQALTSAMKSGQPGEGFVRAVGIVGDELAKHFPAQGESANDLPDALIET